MVKFTKINPAQAKRIQSLLCGIRVCESVGAERDEVRLAFMLELRDVHGLQHPDLEDDGSLVRYAAQGDEAPPPTH